MFVIVLFAVLSQGFAQQNNYSSTASNSCPNLTPGASSSGSTSVPTIQYQTFVTNNSDNQNIDTVCYRLYSTPAILNPSYIAVAFKINTTGGVDRKVSTFTQPSQGKGILTPGFGSKGGVFTETVLDFSDCNSKLSFSCSSVGDAPPYAVATTATRGQKFTAECKAKAIQVLTQLGLLQPQGYIALPMNYISLCDKLLKA